MIQDLVRWTILCIAALILMVPQAGGAADYPTKPVRVIVPWAAGTAWDVRVRQLADAVSQSLGQPVIVQNRPGAGGTLGADVVAKAPPDGYTLLAGSQAEQSIAPAVYTKLPYDPTKDFAPVAQVVAGTLVLVVHPSVNAATVKELIALAKRQPGQLTCATYGYGTLTHLLLSEFTRLTETSISHVPYKNAAEGLADVVAGRVSMMLDFYTTSGQFIQTEKLRAVMVVAPRRHRALPDVPTAVEMGLPTLARQTWGGLLAPAHTPREIIDRLNKEFVKAAQAPTFKDSLEAAGGEVLTSTPEQFRALIQKDRDEYQRLAKQSGAKID